MADSSATYPMTRENAQKRFTFGLIYDVATVLEAHGYGPFDGPQFVELNLHLLHFLLGDGDRCMGRASVAVATGEVR